VQIGSWDLGPENVPALRTLLPSCLGLVIAEAFLATVHLVCFTLQEHLPIDCTSFHNPHSTTAEVCLIYLNIGYVWSLSPTLRSTLEQCRFSNMILLAGVPPYNGDDAHAKILVLRLLGKFDKHMLSAQPLLFCYYTMLNNRISYIARSHRRVGCVTHQRDYMGHRYFLG